MTGMDITSAFVLVAVAIVVVFDAYVIIRHGTKKSISAYIILLSYSYPIIPLLAGIVIGHLFWQTPAIVCGGQ